MQTKCNPQNPLGINKNCLNFPAPMEIAALGAASLEIASLDLVKNPQTWIDLVQSLALWVPGGGSSYTVTTPDPTQNTTQKGKQILTRVGVPSMLAMIESNACDFNSVLNNVIGGTYGVPMFLEDNTVIMRKIPSKGTFGLMLANVNGYTKGVPLPEAVEESFPMNFNFTTYKQFKDQIIVQLPFNMADELALNSPLGMTIINEDIPALGVQNIQINQNCVGGDDTILIADIEFTNDGNVDTPSITSLTLDANGKYEATFEKGAVPDALASGDFFYYRIKVISGSIVSKVSDIILFRQP